MPTQLKSQFSRPPFHVKSQFPRSPFGEGRLVLQPLGSNKQPFLRGMVSDFGATHPYPFQMLVPPSPPPPRAPEAFTNLWQFTLHNCWAYIYQQYLLNMVGNLLPSSWIILTVSSFMLGKISWAMKGWSKIMRKFLLYRRLPNSG